MNKIKNLATWLWRKLCAFWPWYKNLYQGRAWYTKTLVGIVSCIIAFILYLGAVDINLFWLFGKSLALEILKPARRPRFIVQTER